MAADDRQDRAAAPRLRIVITERLRRLLRRPNTYEQRLKDLGATDAHSKRRGYAPPFPNPGPVTPVKRRNRGR